MTRNDGSTRDDSWTNADAYERFMGRWSRRIAPRFVAWLDAPPGARWVDVGSGTGALSGAILAAARPASVVGIEPSESFLGAARRNVHDRRVRFVSGSSEAIPLPDASADVAVAGLVLNFVDDPRAAVIEMGRVVAPGGIVGTYVWDYGDGMRILQAFWRAAMALDPAARTAAEGLRFPLAAPGPLADLFASSGLADVRGSTFEMTAVFADFEDYWEPFLGGTGPAAAYVSELGEDARAGLREELRRRLPSEPDGTIHLPIRAWAVAGRVREKGSAARGNRKGRAAV